MSTAALFFLPFLLIWNAITFVAAIKFDARRFAVVGVVVSIALIFGWLLVLVMLFLAPSGDDWKIIQLFSLGILSAGGAVTFTVDQRLAKLRNKLRK